MTASQVRWRHRLVSMFTERIGLKAAALAFALVLWFMVTSKEPTEEIVPVQLALTVDSAHVLRGPLPTVHALVAGEGKEIFALYSTPPVIRRNLTSDADSITLTLSPHDLEFPLDVTVVARDVQPRTIVVHLDPRDTTR